MKRHVAVQCVMGNVCAVKPLKAGRLVEKAFLLLMGIFATVLAGCGGGNGLKPDFAIAVTPAQIPLTAGGAPQTMMLTTVGRNGFAGPVAVSIESLPVGVTVTPAHLSLMPGALSTVTITASAAAKGGVANIGFTGVAGTIEHSVSASVEVSNNNNQASTPDFSLMLSPTSLSAVAGGAGQVLTVLANPQNGFNGSVSFSVGTLPAGIVASPVKLSLSPGTLGQIKIYAAPGAAAGANTITVTATSGALQHSGSVAVTVTTPPPPDFALEGAPASFTAVAGGTDQTWTVGALAENGFQGYIHFMFSGLPAGVTISPAGFSSNAGSLLPIHIQAAAGAPAGTTNIVLTATSGTLTHSISAALTVTEPPPPNFTLQVSPSSSTLVAGGAPQTLTVGASAVNGFNGTITLNTGPVRAGITVTPGSFSLKAGQLAQLQVSASSTTSLGAASVTLTATSGTITHSVSVPLTVSAAPPSDFKLEVTPAALTLVAGGTAQTLSVAAIGGDGFAGKIAVKVGPLPAGVTANPASLSLLPGGLAQISLKASLAAETGNSTIAVTGSSGSFVHSASEALTVNAPPPAMTTAALSTTKFDFGDNIVKNKVTKTAVLVTNTGQGVLTIDPALTGDPSFAIVSSQSCGSQLAAGATCRMELTYDPTVASLPDAQNAVLDLGFGNVLAGTPHTVAILGTSAALTAQVTGTNNPQVARYTLTLPYPGSMSVGFGTTSSLGHTTWSQGTDEAGGKVSILVAGMLAQTQYHLQATVTFSNGLVVKDSEHLFTTGSIPSNMLIKLSTTTTPGMTPQPGLEMLQALAGRVSGVLVTDLAGNTLWTYANPGVQALNSIQGAKMLSNGDFLLPITAASGAPLQGPVPPDAFTELREVNLAGDTVRELNIQDLNASLATASCAECHVTVYTFHHEIEPLPNGHWLVMSNTTMALSPTSTPALTNAPPQTVLGDVIIDLDENMKPVWAWNEFNHLDPNRHPFQFPDWTHSNAIVYSPDDGSILISIRHQNWVVKVNYANGAGDGDILWKLGEGGDFTLSGGSDPEDWEYAQHGPAFFSPNTSGVFSLGLMDNGDDRVFPAGDPCATNKATPCFFSTIPIFQIDEKAKTAALTFHQKLPTSLYSFFGGNADWLANGNVEYDLCGLGGFTGIGSQVFEVTQESTPQTVWTMQVQGTNLYRAFRIPSFYPGVQW